jgi:hypothetical protein
MSDAKTCEVQWYGKEVTECTWGEMKYYIQGISLCELRGGAMPHFTRPEPFVDALTLLNCRPRSWHSARKYRCSAGHVYRLANPGSQAGLQNFCQCGAPSVLTFPSDSDGPMVDPLTGFGEWNFACGCGEMISVEYPRAMVRAVGEDGTFEVAQTRATHMFGWVRSLKGKFMHCSIECEVRRARWREESRPRRHQVWAELTGKCGADDCDGGWADIGGVRTICALPKGHDGEHESRDGVKWSSQ